MLRRFLMSDQYTFVSADQLHPDPYAQSRTAERTLNAAIVQADISRSFEEYLEIFDQFYGDDIEVSSETQKEPIRGKARVGNGVFSCRGATKYGSRTANRWKWSTSRGKDVR